jgi:hypothetical protein
MTKDPAMMHAPHSLLFNGVDLVKAGMYSTIKYWKNATKAMAAQKYQLILVKILSKMLISYWPIFLQLK